MKISKTRESRTTSFKNPSNFKFAKSDQIFSQDHDPKPVTHQARQAWNQEIQIRDTGGCGRTDGKYLNSAARSRGEGRRGAGLPLLPHKYGFSRAVYERKRVEAREALAAPKLLKS